jgi:hypothetical protein
VARVISRVDIAVAVNPYQAPTTAPLQPVLGGQDHQYEDQGGRVRLLTGLLAAGAVLGVVAMGSTWLEMDLLERAQRGNVTIAEAEANDARQGLIGILTLVLHLVTMVIFAMFLVRANKNARAVSGHALEVTPGWMIGWFFILFKPYVAVREVWERSKGAAPPLFGLWWAAWVLSGILGQIVWRMVDPNDSIPELLSTDRVVLASEAVDIASALLAMWMVRALHAGQQRHHQTGRPDLAGL